MVTKEEKAQCVLWFGGTKIECGKNMNIMGLTKVTLCCRKSKINNKIIVSLTNSCEPTVLI